MAVDDVPPGSAVEPVGAVVEELVRAQRHQDPLALLTEREREVLALVAEGRSDKSIADRLVVSVKTVEGAIAAAS